MQEGPINFVPVRFVYLGPSGAEDLDRQFEGQCISIPRIGEHVEILGRGSAMASAIYNRFVADEAGEYIQYITVVLRD